MSLVDQMNEPGDLDQLRKDLTEATTKPEEEPAAKEEPNPEAEVPDKYRGKSVIDVIDMHRNAESALGRTANELGQYKQLTDQLLNLKRTDDLRKGGASEAELEEDPVPDISSTELLDNPAAAVNRVVETRLKNDERKRQAKEMEQRLAAQAEEFATKHPDAGEIAQNPEFVEWVQSSPIRRRAALMAYNKDWQAGTDLLDEWKATHSEESKPEEPEKNLDEAKKASTVSTGASQTGDVPRGKIYRRLDLIRLKLEDPEAYSDPGFQQEIMTAYQEGRVK